MKKGTVYLISGQICSGKTTYSKRLEKMTNAVRFTPDEWMLKLYPFSINNEEFDSYYYVCCDVAWAIAKKLVARGIDVILDFGFWKKTDRLRYIELIHKVGSNYKLIYVACKEATIRKRLEKRNGNLPEDCFHITDEMFNFFAPGFQPPSSKEEIFEIFDNNG